MNTGRTGPGQPAVLARCGKLSLTDATLGMVPGGSAAVVSCADDLGADSRIVAFSQYLRVGLVGLTAPAIALGFRRRIRTPRTTGCSPCSRSWVIWWTPPTSWGG